MSKVIGIDLGTTNSVVAVLENNRAEVIPNAEGSKTTPSIVLIGDDEIVVGELAKRQRISEAGRVVHSIKRFMGARIEEVDDKLQGITYDIGPDDEGMATAKINDRLYRPEAVSAEILKKMAKTASDYLGEDAQNAVITVPAHFNDSQRQATKRAAEQAGLNCLRILNEPTAAALAYGINVKGKKKIAVFDFGGGTFDISILELDGDIFEVKSTGGDTFLGGDTIDQALTDWIAKQILQETGVDPYADPKAVQRIGEVAEKVKCELSTLKQTLISLPFIVSDAEGPKHFERELTRELFTGLIADILERLREPCVRAVEDAGVTLEELDHILLVGGSTRIPAVRELVAEIFEKEPDTSLNPDEAVACGAAIQSAILNGDLVDVLLLDVTPLSLGLELEGDVFSVLIPRNSNVPTTVAKKFTTVVDNQSTVRIHALQGERKKAAENRSLAHLRLEEIPPAPKEIPEIEVEFHLDANGILTVSALDLTTGQSKEVVVESYSAVAAEKASEKVVADAAEHAEEDRIFLHMASVKQRLDEMETEIESMIERTEGRRLTEEQRQACKEAFFKLEVAIASNEWSAVEEAERNARAVFLEVSSINALQTASPDSGTSIVDLNQPGLETDARETGS